MLDTLTSSTPYLGNLASANASLANAKDALSTKPHTVKNMQEITEAAKDFESMFLTEMLTHMFDTVGIDENFGGGQGEETWRGMMVEQYSKQIVKSGGIGMSDAIKTHMINMQEALDKQ